MEITKIVLLINGLMLITGQAYAAEVAVVPSTQIVTPGTNFNINVTIDPIGTAIAGAQFNIAFNQSIIKVNGITEGNLFKQNGTDTFFNNGTINNSLGTVINIFDAIIGRYGVSTLGTFVIVNLTATGSSGTSWINLSNIKISDLDGLPVSLSVTNQTVRVSSPPVLGAIGNRTIDEGKTLTFTLSANDPDGDALIFSATNMPSGASFNSSTRIFKWTPNFTQSGSYPKVHFEVSDGAYTDSENITITVNNINRAPSFTFTPANGSVFNETDSIQIRMTASDPDGDPLTYLIKIDDVKVSTASSYTWDTNYTSSGYHNINSSVSDGKATVFSSITIYIRNIHPRYDVDDTGVVDVSDIVIIGQNFNQTVNEPYPRYDINEDGIVNIQDLTIAAQHFGEQT